MFIYICLAVAAIIAIVDQVLKYLVVSNIGLGETLCAIPNILDLTYVKNTGVAFGMFKDLRFIFIILTSIIVVVFIFLLFKMGNESKLFAISSALVIGGGIGNLIDRIFLGYIVDYLSLSFFSPICNFADYCISAGTVLLVVYLLFFYDDKDKENKSIKECK